MTESASSTARGSRWRVWIWWLSSCLVVVAVSVLAATQRRELAAAVTLLAHVHRGRLYLAVGFEAAAVFSLAALQQWLLRAAGYRFRLGFMAGFVVAANAMAGALPGGAAFSLAWSVRQLHRRRVSVTAALAMLAAAGVLSVLSLVSLLISGALVADPAGPAPELRTVVLETAAACSLLALAAFVLARFARVRRTAGRLWRRVGHGRPAVARLRDNVEQTVGKALAAYPDAGGWARPFSAALSNWVCDAVALALCLWSLGIPVPWRGFLMAYALTQVLSSLRVTPGSLGVAEASLSGLLVLYGLPADQAIAATLLYRILGFWVLQPIGWASWLVLTLHDPQLTRGADGRPPAASP